MILKRFHRQRAAPVGLRLAPMVELPLLLVLCVVALWYVAQAELHADLELPAATVSTPAADLGPDRVVVNLDAAGAIYVSGTCYSRTELAALLNEAAERQEASPPKICIRADAGLPFGQVRKVMLFCRNLGLRDVALRTTAPAPAGKPAPAGEQAGGGS